MEQKTKTLELVQTALLAAIIFVLAFSPYIGYIRIPVLAIQATTVHIPVIVGSIVLGPKKGAILGGCFGLTSLLNNTFTPGITSFVFSPFIPGGNILSLVICFVPRILVGVVPYYVYKLTKGKESGSTGSKVREKISLIISGIAGSLTNTILVMSMIFFFFGKSYAAAREIAYNTVVKVILSVVAINGTCEAIVAALITAVIVTVLFKIKGVKKA